jgi:hypothetical protein
MRCESNALLQVDTLDYLTKLTYTAGILNLSSLFIYFLCHAHVALKARLLQASPLSFC